MLRYILSNTKIHSQLDAVNPFASLILSLQNGFFNNCNGSLQYFVI